MPVFATVHLLISVPKGQHYFRIYFFYFHQNLEGHLWKINPCIFIFSYQCDLGDSTVNERDKKDMIWETLRLQIRKKKKFCFWSVIQQLISWNGILMIVYKQCMKIHSGLWQDFKEPAEPRWFPSQKNQFPVNGEEAKILDQH